MLYPFCYGLIVFLVDCSLNVICLSIGCFENENLLVLAS